MADPYGSTDPHANTDPETPPPTQHRLDPNADPDDVDDNAPQKPKQSAIAWMSRNSVAANLLMFVLLAGGGLMGMTMKQEVFPAFELDLINVGVPYPGASPAEVEQGMVLAIEEAVRGIDGVKRVTASAAEGSAGVSIELLLGADKDRALADVKAAVDRISSFPQDAERPTVSLLSNRRQVITLVVYGDVDEKTRHSVAERVREELLADKRVTQADVQGVRSLEIAVEVPSATLRAYNLTLPAIANAIRRHAVELPAGAIKTTGGEILLRTAERRNAGREFADIPIVSRPDGSDVRLGDIAHIRDAFSDDDRAAFYNGKPAAMVSVFRVGNETPMTVAGAVHEYVKKNRANLPDGVEIDVWMDRSEMYRGRMNLLLRNAFLGLALVLFVLGLFLEVRLAFWVTMGIPISFLGSLLIVPQFGGVSLNMISLFAFIVALGMVVDDAIVVGENVFNMRRKGVPPMKAAIDGAKGVAMPVTFAILTTVTAFAPLFFVPGFMGKMFMQIPAVVVSVFMVSLIESLFVLPAHLAHLKPEATFFLLRWINKVQQPVARSLERFVANIYSPALRGLLKWRYSVVAVGIAILIATVGFVRGGHIDFSFMPKVEGNRITANAELVFGSPVADTQRVTDQLVKAAQRTLEKHGGDKILRGIYAEIGSNLRHGGPGPASRGGGRSNLAGVRVNLVGSDKRNLSAADFARLWRDELGDVPGLESLVFRYSMGPNTGDAVSVELSHKDMGVLERASADLARKLATFKGVKDIDDGFSAGKPQLDFHIRPEATSLGITASDLARQARSAFYGAEAIRQQRGRDEVRVMVRLPKSERISEHDLSKLMLRAPDGKEVPLEVAAELRRGRSYTTIRRLDGKRYVDVTADIDKTQTGQGKVLKALKDSALPELMSNYPGLTWTFGGSRKHRNEALGALGEGFMFAMMVMFALLAVPFKSYVQPAVVMSAIPFGIVGAVVGHVVMGFELSIISMMGIVALSGVVVNDSLVLVDAANRKRRLGASYYDSIAWAGQRRFRPILLTSLTTFLGLAPMILEPSVQARFLVPMAVSLGFGILFATLIVLVLVPCFYLIVEDLRGIYIVDEHPYSEELPQRPAARGGDHNEGERTVVINPV
jgi:multidrug efflux pump subunit AcrB